MCVEMRIAKGSNYLKSAIYQILNKGSFQNRCNSAIPMFNLHHIASLITTRLNAFSTVGDTIKMKDSGDNEYSLEPFILVLSCHRKKALYRIVINEAILWKLNKGIELFFLQSQGRSIVPQILTFVLKQFFYTSLSMIHTFILSFHLLLYKSI